MPAAAKNPPAAAPLWGLFGGSFDPIHNGHVATVLAVAQQLNLAKVMYLPAARSPFKPAGRIADAQRIALIKLAIKKHAMLALDPRELSRPPPSYTIDTLSELALEFPARRWVLLLGADAWHDFAAWRQADKILQLSHIAVMTRPGYAARPMDSAGDSAGDSAMDSAAANSAKASSANSMRLRRYKAGKVVYITVPEMAISATQIRARLAKGLAVSDALNPAVAAYIKQHKLYQ